MLSFSALYHRHTLVVTSNKLWSTIKHSTPLNLLELLNECSVKLVYLGQLRFGELKAQPRRPPRPIPIKSSANKNNAVEDEESVGQPAASSTKNTNIEAVASTECLETNNSNELHVQTESDVSHVGTKDNSVHVGMSIETRHMETTTPEQGSEHVGTHSVLYVVTTDSPLKTTKNAVVQNPTVNNVDVVITQEDSEDTHPVPAPLHDTTRDPPPKPPKLQKCTLKLVPLKQLDIDVWCNKVSDHHRFTQPKPTETTATIGEDTGYTLRKRKSKADITGISL